MRVSQTPPDRRSAGTFSAIPTWGRYGAMRRLPYGRTCRLSRKRTTSTPSPTGRFLRAFTTGRRTPTRRSSTSGSRAAGASRHGEPSATTDGTRRRAASGGRLCRTEAARGKEVRERQDPAPARLRVKSQKTTTTMRKSPVQQVRRLKPLRSDPARRRRARSEPRC